MKRGCHSINVVVVFFFFGFETWSYFPSSPNVFATPWIVMTFHRIYRRSRSWTIIDSLDCYHLCLFALPCSPSKTLGVIRHIRRKQQSINGASPDILIFPVVIGLDRFEGAIQASKGQAFFLVFCTALCFATLALVLQIQFPAIGNYWFLLTLLSPYAWVPPSYWSWSNFADKGT